MAKKWPEPIIEQSFKSNIRFRSVFSKVYTINLKKKSRYGTKQKSRFAEHEIFLGFEIDLSRPCFSEIRVQIKRPKKQFVLHISYSQSFSRSTKFGHFQCRLSFIFFELPSFLTFFSFVTLFCNDDAILLQGQVLAGQPHCKYIQCNLYTFYLCPTFHCNPTVLFTLNYCSKYSGKM